MLHRAILVAGYLAVAAAATETPSIVFLICESISGRTFWQDSPVPLPNIDRLRAMGAVDFARNYVAVPVCAPSRSSIWSGRMPNSIPHQHPGQDFVVQGVYNNYEGLPEGYDQKIGDVLAKQAGYNVRISGKTDYTVGGHAEWNWLQCFTQGGRFPFNLTEGGWDEQPRSNDCRQTGTVTPGNRSHIGDWTTLEGTTKWIREQKGSQRPWFAYQGMNIVHPPYVTVSKWFDAIDESKVTVPEFQAAKDMHPCTFQSAMLKGCFPNASVPGEVEAFYSQERRRRIRHIYYAMIAEFDAMVGAYIDAVEAAGALNSTIFIVTADHGDMMLGPMQSFYKMQPQDDSALVPLVVYQPGARSSPHRFTAPTSSLDIFPTIMTYAGVPQSQWPQGIAGTSLRPFVEGAKEPDPQRGVVSQGFSTADNAMPWTLLRQGDLKYTVYGTNEQIYGTLFNMSADPDELDNLWNRTSPAELAKLDATLRSIVDYPTVAKDVMAYNAFQLNYWSTQHGGPTNNATWEQRLADLDGIGGGWSQSWAAFPSQSLQVVKSIMATQPPAMPACQGPDASV